MPRPVSGFLTSTGQYFDREEDAKKYEAIANFNEALAKQLSPELGPQLLSYLTDTIRRFVIVNRDVVVDYVALVTEIPEPVAHDIRVPPPQPEPEWTAPDDLELVDIELVDLDPDTGPVSKEEDATDPDFISAFEPGGMGEPDGVPETSGNDEVVRQPE